MCVLSLSRNLCAQEGWKQHQAEHFIIYYKNAPADFVGTVEEMAELYYKEITENLGFTRYKNWTFDRRAKVYICDDKEDYIQTAVQAGWSHGVAFLQKKEILTYPAAHGFFDSTLPHELGHIIFREFIGFNSQIPLWLDEGVAMFQEKAKRWGANKIVKKAIKENKFIPLAELAKIRLDRNTPEDIVELFYAESASVVYYMVTDLGQHRFVRLCREINKGESFEAALRAVYLRFKNVDDLNRNWIKYLENE